MTQWQQQQAQLQQMQEEQNKFILSKQYLEKRRSVKNHEMDSDNYQIFANHIICKDHQEQPMEGAE